MTKSVTCFKCDKEGLRWARNRQTGEWSLRDVTGYEHKCSTFDLQSKYEHEVKTGKRLSRWERNRRKLLNVRLTERDLESGLLDDLGIE